MHLCTSAILRVLLLIFTETRHSRPSTAYSSRIQEHLKIRLLEFVILSLDKDSKFLKEELMLKLEKSQKRSEKLLKL